VSSSAYHIIGRQDFPEYLLEILSPAGEESGCWAWLAWKRSGNGQGNREAAKKAREGLAVRAQVFLTRVSSGLLERGFQAHLLRVSLISSSYASPVLLPQLYVVSILS